jgi:hypothetical protein
MLISPVAVQLHRLRRLPYLGHTILSEWCRYTITERIDGVLQASKGKVANLVPAALL